MPIKPTDPPIPKSVGRLPKSGIFKLGRRDLLRGGVLAVFTGVMSSVYEMASAGSFSWGTLGFAVIAAVSGYILMNLSTNNTGKLFQKDE
jgi:hypothetical protein